MPDRFSFGHMAVCPHVLLREHVELLGQVARVVRDYRAGVVTGWPDSFTAVASEAVYGVLEHADAAQESVQARDARTRR